jgi:predicted CXXCH cytochrome family protein
VKATYRRLNLTRRLSWSFFRLPRPPATFVGVLVAAGAVLVAPVALCSAESPAQPSDVPTFVGSAACGGCHEGEMAAWRSSQHALAIQEATAETVLGDFDDASFTHGGVTSRFFNRDGKFLVATDGPDGKLGEFEIRYTFGVYPLQQYLIAFPDGRMQALGIAWDARPEDQGGQRWFHLYPDRELKAGDPLHWTGIDQTWNFMCAECHSTELHKNYDAAANTYATTWAEINVACEACHGPGSAHVAWGERQQSWLPWGKGGDNGLTVRFDERAGVHWVIDPATGNARRSAPKTGATELETCGICHSRSARIAEGWRPGQQLLDTHVPSLLQPGLFEADGKMLDEVYNYASFRQSRMFMQGVTCSDCHEPHSLQLRAEGNGVCYQCHEQAMYGAVSHHRHAEGSPAAGCPACHMPARTYMVVDRRHDHGFRIPRPDLSVRFDVSNACNDCHADKDAAWAAAAVERWYGPERKGFQTWTEAFAAARDDTAEAGPLLLQLATEPGAPAIARASAFEMLAAHPGPEAAGAVQQGLADADPLVRLGALRALRWLPAAQTWPLAHGLLDDPVRGVRLEAASLLAAMPQDQLAPADRQRLARAVDDYVAAQRLNADRPEARVNLGNLYAQQGQSGAAEAEYLAARTLDPDFVPTYVMLAQLYARQTRDADGEWIVHEALARLPDNPELHFTLGLNLVRQHQATEAIPEFARAAELDPANPRYAYVQGVALNSTGRTDDALEVLEAAQARHPADRDTLLALATINRDAGRMAAALSWADRLVALDPQARTLRDEIARRAGQQP